MNNENETKEEKIKRQKKASYLRNLDKSRATLKSYREKNKDAIKDYAKEYYNNNKERFRQNSSAYSSRVKKERPWIMVLQCAKRRALDKGIEFSLTKEWAASIWTGKCALSGLEFIVDESGIPGPKPFSATVDKIIPALGYIPSNCRFILSCVNNFRGTLGDEEMYRVAEALGMAHGMKK